MDLSKVFADMAAGKMNGKGQKLGDGRYTVRSKLMKLKQGGHFGDSFIFEYDVVKSENPDHPVGSSRTYTVNMSRTQAFGDIKAVIFALIMQIEPSTIKDPPQNQKEHDEATEWFKKIVNGEDVSGLDVDVEVQWKKTRENRDFGLHKWIPAVDEAPPAQAA